MNWIEVDDLSDSRFDRLRDLKGRTPGGLPFQFVAEGRWVVERLLASDIAVDFVLAARDSIGDWKPRIPDATELYCAPLEEIRKLVGFSFHRGILAVANRPRNEVSAIATNQVSQRWLACPKLADAQNLGSLIRSAAAFGFTGVMVGDGCPDSYSRQVIRVSAGCVFGIRIVEPVDLFSDLLRLKRDDGFRLITTGAASRPTGQTDQQRIQEDASSEPFLWGESRSKFASITSANDANRIVVMVGAEDFGLEARWHEISDFHLSIPMSSAVDSLNVAVAGAICMFELSRHDESVDGR